MKLLGGIIEISTISDKQYPGDTAGDSMVATLAGSASKGETAQIHSQPGLIGKPPKGSKGIRLRIGSIDVIISHINYKITPPENQGETKVYSTDTDGEEQATHELTGLGEHVFNGGTKEAARNGDTTLVDGTTDAAFIAWIATVSTFINGLAPGTIPNPPTSATGQITTGTSEVLLP